MKPQGITFETVLKRSSFVRRVQVDHDLTQSPQAWIKTEKYPWQTNISDWLHVLKVLHFSFQGWYFHLLCFYRFPLAPHSQYLFQQFTPVQLPLIPTSSTFCMSFAKPTHPFLHCDKSCACIVLRGNWKHWRKSLICILIQVWVYSSSEKAEATILD